MTGFGPRGYAGPEAGRHLKQIPTLDGTRGLAILLVLIYHETLLSLRMPESTLDLWFARVTYSGWCGVDLFFVLSGFLITGLLLDAKRHPNYFRNFYARRTLRIFPLFYAVVFLSLVVIPNLPSGLVPAAKAARFGSIGGDEWWYWLYLSNFAVARAGEWRHAILDVSWSLAIEEQFYLVWPSVVLLCSRRTLVRVCLALVVVAPAIRLVMTLAGAHPIAVYVVTPARVDPLAVGALIAIAARTPHGLERLVGPARAAIGITLGLLGAGFLARGGLSAEDPLVQIVGFSTLAILFGALMVLVLEAAPGSTLSRVFASRMLRTLGKYSYALYLFHLPLRALVRDTFYGYDQFPIVFGSLIPAQLLFYVIATALTLGVAMLSWVCWEQPFLRLKRFFGEEASRARAPDVVDTSRSPS